MWGRSFFFPNLAVLFHWNIKFVPIHAKKKFCYLVLLQGSVPTLSIDNTSGCQLYLSKESLEASITTAKSSEINALIPDQKNDGDWVSNNSTNFSSVNFRLLLFNFYGLQMDSSGVNKVVWTLTFRKLDLVLFWCSVFHEVLDISNLKFHNPTLPRINPVHFRNSCLQTWKS